jgi:hypothetical protein
MGMRTFFSWRKARASDLDECLALHPEKIGDEAVGRAAAMKAWRALHDLRHAVRSVVVEKHSNGKAEIVGFGLAAFVKKAFADAEVRNPQPGLNGRIIASVASGNSVIATYEEVREANTNSDLEQVILDTSWNIATLDDSQIFQVRVILGRAYQEIHAGYRMSRILYELVDERDFVHLQNNNSFRVIDRFEEFRRANPGTGWNPDRALTAATTESMRADPHSIAAGLFHHFVEPQFGLTRAQQELLESALDGMDDQAVAQDLSVSVAAIKRRWQAIFERIAPVRPDLCPADGEGKRGIQKRQRVLAHVREHMEEIRPFMVRGRDRREKRLAASSGHSDLALSKP